jgi:two-component system sensor kinase FixL
MVEAGLLVFLQFMLITGFLIERSRRKRAEKDSEQTREHLTHLSRVSALGELAASLAHEVNQPLTSILLNAQTAIHLLSSSRVQAEELQAILQDIVDDDLRASEVIVRIRELASHHATERIPISVNEVVQEVTKLVNKDLLLRQVSLDVNLAPDLSVVEGDRVQLKQVVLNLLINAVEAVSLSNRDPGTVAIRTEMSVDRSVHVVVQDNGSGLPNGMEQKVFEPFYTTKKSGMGMGLSIARSIIESHGGNIWANPGAERGAEFHFALPALNAKTRKAGVGRPGD